MYVCMYICICTRNQCVYVLHGDKNKKCIYVCICVCICKYMHMCVCICVCIYMYIYILWLGLTLISTMG